MTKSSYSAESMYFLVVNYSMIFQNAGKNKHKSLAGKEPSRAII